MAGFWSALAYADVKLPPPLTWGVVKGLLLRNLRWWTTQKETLTPQGTLTIGYSYPNQFMSENYNSPGSPYWFMLSFVALALPKDHAFWQAQEEPYPTQLLPQVISLKHPKQILIRKGGHTFLLSSGQRCHYPVRASESKYGKFAYSSAFGYSVPTGNYFVEAVGGDNMMALSDDDGDTWKLRRLTLDAHIEEHNGSPVLVSEWKPWSDVTVTTYLIPPEDATPNWHLRLHRVVTSRALSGSEGAFALYGTRQDDGRGLELLSSSGTEGRTSGDNNALALTASGVVGIRELQRDVRREGRVLFEDANSNLLHSRSVLPSLFTQFSAGSETWLTTAVYAVPTSAKEEMHNWQTTWENPPSLPQGMKNRIT